MGKAKQKEGECEGCDVNGQKRRQLICKLEDLHFTFLPTKIPDLVQSMFGEQHTQYTVWFF